MGTQNSETMDSQKVVVTQILNPPMPVGLIKTHDFFW